MKSEVAASMPSREPLTRERILDTAIAIGDAEGIAAVSMRRLGRELGVEAMSLYNHVTNKDDILRGMAGRLLQQMMEAPAGDDTSPLEAIRQMQRRYRRLGLDHPHLFPVIIDQSLTSPESLWPLEQALALLRKTGLPDDEIIDHFVALASLVEGHVLNELRDLDGDRRSFPEATSLDDRFPVTREVLGRTAWDRERGFERALDLLLTGIRHRMEELS